MFFECQNQIRDSLKLQCDEFCLEADDYNKHYNQIFQVYSSTVDHAIDYFDSNESLFETNQRCLGHDYSLYILIYYRYTHD